MRNVFQFYIAIVNKRAGIEGIPSVLRRRYKVYKKEGMYSPIVQNERHVEIIRDIL